MAIKPFCEFKVTHKCENELTDFGGILLSPPNENNEVKKIHICKICYNFLIEFKEKEFIAEAVRKIGGEPSDKEMVKMNEESMKYFAEKLEEEKGKNEVLQKQVEKLEKRDEWLSCLEAAGVDNWGGYDIAINMRDGNN